MTLLQRIGAALLTGAIGISAVGLGAGVANAAPPSPSASYAAHEAPSLNPSPSGRAEPGSTLLVDWHGRGHWHDGDHSYRGAWHGVPWWHPWDWEWRR